MEIQAKKCIYSNAGDFLCILVKPYTGLRGRSANKKISPADISQDLWSEIVFCDIGVVSLTGLAGVMKSLLYLGI